LSRQLRGHPRPRAPRAAAPDPAQLPRGVGARDDGLAGGPVAGGGAAAAVGNVSACRRALRARLGTARAEGARWAPRRWAPRRVRRRWRWQSRAGRRRPSGRPRPSSGAAGAAEPRAEGSVPRPEGPVPSGRRPRRPARAAGARGARRRAPANEESTRELDRSPQSRATAANPAPGARFLDPRVLARLDNLELVARTVVEGFINGLHRSPYLGLSLDFAEHRAYMPGDDIRRIDWRLYARTDRFYVKQFEADTNANVSILLDVSRSMSYGREGIPK